MTDATYNVMTPDKGVPIKAWTKGVPLEDAARQQLLNVAQLPFIYKWVAAMPDVHWGIGATVGSVIPTKGAIIPAAEPVEDHERFKGWSLDIARGLDSIWLPPDSDIPRRSAAARHAISDYFRELIGQRRATPRGDLLSALLAAEEAGDKLNEEELLATCILILIAGHETTVNLIGNGVLALLRHPAELLTDPHLEARQFWQWLERAHVGRHPQPSPPYREGTGPLAMPTPAATLGQYNEEVLGGVLGLSTAELQRLEQANVIGCEALPPAQRKARAMTG